MDLNNDKLNNKPSNASVGGKSGSSHTDPSGDETDSKDDDDLDPTTSKDDVGIPERVEHNVNGLRPLNFNSADDVRQVMRQVFIRKAPQNHQEDLYIGRMMTFHTDLNPTSDLREELPRIEQIPVQNNTTTSNRKRPGRPPKAGSSKRTKKIKITDFYIGKLSNVVPFQRRRIYDSSSDSESGMFY